jgi:imidazole glycerol-phosphate synthase subunit HisH
MNVVVIDYEAGNLRSVETALGHLGVEFRTIADPESLQQAERVIVPGVGDARAAMDVLRRRGFVDPLGEFVRSGRPVLGICLGSQIILDRSEENDARCLGLIRGTAVRFTESPGLKIPHMGWNTITPVRAHPLFEGLPRECSFYFVHSYFPSPEDSEAVLARSEYGERFPAVVGRDNLVATQFHPEKSGEFGLRMLENFLRWSP